MSITIKFLGIAQDAGIPQIACNCKVCSAINSGKQKPETPVALGLINNNTGKKFLVEASPELPNQYQNLLDVEKKEKLSGILVTHAHIGHYAGLMFLGREALNTKEMPVYTSKKMGDFLSENAPWNQLTKLNNINIVNFQNSNRFMLDENLYITPIEVSHRNEYADTFGFIIENNETNNKVFFLPDIDSWNGFENELKNLINICKFVILDATFYTKQEITEITGRDAKEIPHPSIEETIEFVLEHKLDPKKVIFTHFNHTNKILHDKNIYNDVCNKGFIISKDGLEIEI